MRFKRVIVFGLDGIGNAPKNLNIPNLNKIIQNGLYTFNGRTMFPPISGECWGTIIHGVEPTKHGLNNDIAMEKLWPYESPYPSMFKIIKNKIPDSKLASFCNWNAINTGIIEENLDMIKDTGSDEELTQKVVNYLKENDPTLLFLVYDDCDHAGHDYGYFTKPYFDQIEKTDQEVGKVMEILEKKNMLNDSLLVLVTDHGGGGVDPKDHMYDHPLDMTVCFACSGPNVPHKEIENYTVEDAPSIILSALGIEKPSGWKGRTLDEI